MSDAAWAGFLDSLESELHAVERARGRRPRGAIAFLPPPGLGPLPRELAARAKDVLGRIEHVTALVTEDLRRTSSQLRELDAMHGAGPRRPTTFDSHA